MNTLLAAGWGPLIPFIVFFVFLTLSLMHAAYRRSQRSDRSESGGWDGLPEPLEQGEEVSGGTIVGRYVRPEAPPQMWAPSPRQLSPWEQELERILQNAPPPQPEPVLEPIRPVTVASAPSPFDWSSINQGPSVEQMSDSDLEGASLNPIPAASLATAHPKVASLQERVQSYLHHLDAGASRPVAAIALHRPVVSAEMAAFVANFRTPTTARQAILASLILGPPKGLEI